MKAFVITLDGDDYSTQGAKRCINSAARNDLQVEKFSAIDKENALRVMEENDLEWTWANGNTTTTTCKQTGLKQFPYTTKDLRTRIGCAMSHYLLWKKCIELVEPIVILEHDAVFIHPFPADINFKGICQINDPNGATRRGNWWSSQMVQRGGYGVFEKTWVTKETERDIPDGLAGNSAYIIKPWAAQELVNKYHELGVWPNDATMCKQLFPYLEEFFPFITKVVQTKSTTIG
jgi:GR25 family glycosyltransferase involved in LPS biosynthesis